MPELGPYGSVRGARGNSRPYRDKHTLALRSSQFEPKADNRKVISVKAGSVFAPFMLAAAASSGVDKKPGVAGGHGDKNRSGLCNFGTGAPDGQRETARRPFSVRDLPHAPNLH